jgi:uncharacterized protein
MSKSISSLIEARISRRGFLEVGFTAASLIACHKSDKSTSFDTQNQVGAGFDFVNLGACLDQDLHLSQGHTSYVLLRWGDPLFEEDSNERNPSTLTPEEQSRRFGFNNDYIAFYPFEEERALLIVNHESTHAGIMFPSEEGYCSTSIENIQREMAAHGLTIVCIQLVNQRWTVDRSSPFNRRITAHTPMRISGPCAGHPFMRTIGIPEGTMAKGTLHNCSGGQTPWGTVLTCEENILYYFKSTDPEMSLNQLQKRYGIGHMGAYNWHRADERFELSSNPNLPNHFGWVVEINPLDPTAPPIKRTALGRFFHESANPILNCDGRVVIYMGDDGYFEYLYRFVSSKVFSPSDEQTNDLLDDGELSVALFHEDGSLQWLPLVHGVGPLTAENGFDDQPSVLINARTAADLLGATPLDRTEDVEPRIGTGTVIVNCTKNPKRGKEGHPSAHPASPRHDNIAGHIIELSAPKLDMGFDHASHEMSWSILLLAGDPKREGTSADYGKALVDDAYFGCPDNACFDPSGRLWVTTDGSEMTVEIADGLYGIDVDGPNRGRPRRFLAAPIGAEVTGPCFTPDGRSLFVSIQHPGVSKGSSHSTPSTRWPDFSPELPPRPSVVCVQREDSGTIG